MIHRGPLAAILSAALFVACGGGGSSGDPAPTAPVVANAFSDLQGSYAVACRAQPGATTNYSDQLTITVSELIGTDRANVSVRARGYQSPAADKSGAQCDPAALTDDVTVTGQMRDLGRTVALKGPANKPVNVRLVELTYYGFTLAKGSLGDVAIPLPNATTQIGYLLDGNALYVTKGLRGLDASGAKLSSRFGERSSGPGSDSANPCCSAKCSIRATLCDTP